MEVGMKIKQIVAGLLAGIMVTTMIPFDSIVLAKEVNSQVLQAENEAITLSDAAIYAKVSSDYTSSWEKLDGINDKAFEPTVSAGGTGKGWGNWSQEAGSAHWVEYDWPAEITTDTFEIFWYDDSTGGGATKTPATIGIQYKDGTGNWKDATMLSQYADVIALDKYNTIKINPVTTKAIRLNMTVSTGYAAIGIYRFKVLSNVDESYVLNADKETLTLPSSVSSDFYLKPTGNNGSTITWTENHNAIAIDGRYAVVTRGSEDVAGTLTAILSDGTNSVTKDITVTVAKKTRESVTSAVDFTKVHINDKFWSSRQKQFICSIIPVGISKVEEASGGIPNLINAAKKNRGETYDKYVGSVYFLDSDPYKMVEAMSYALQINAGEDADILAGQQAIKSKLEEWIPYIQGAQETSGYLDTYFTLENSDTATESSKPGKWTNFALHEMYCVGHFYEAAVAHFRATGDKRLLDVAVKSADYINGLFGVEEEKWKQVPGHEEIELALIKLAAACQEAGGDYTAKSKEYIKLAKFFIDNRGITTDRHGYNSAMGDYDQDHMLVTEQTEAVGHAVRAMYLYTAMADVALLDDTNIYDHALLSLWENVTEKKSYVTGGIGSSASNEGFGKDYELPNETAYCETCANIGSVMWNERMNLLYGDSKYVDVIERTLYNSVISCVNFEGDKFFYGNPMSSNGSSGRSAWFGCACCPPNLMRLVENLGSYVYTQNQDVLTLNLYIGNEATFNVNSKALKMKLDTEMPWYGTSKLTVTQSDNVACSLRLRIPEWATGKNEIKLNGEAISTENLDSDGYLVLTRTWKTGDVIDINFPMAIERTHTPDQVTTNVGYTAIQRGPMVYAAEEVDNNFNVHKSYLPTTSQFTETWADNLMNDASDEFGIKSGIKLSAQGKTIEDGKETEITWTLIPYFSWNNRGVGDMKVYLSEKPVEVKLRDYAKASASYSYGSTLGQINDGSTGSFWHTWASDSVRQNPWVTYEFEKKVKLNGCSVNWMEDASGVRVPSSVKIEYWNGIEWNEVNKTSNNYTTCTASVYNDYLFEEVETEKIRMTMVNGVIGTTSYAVGIYEWDLLGSMIEDTITTDKTALSATIQTAKKLKEAEYTTVSFSALKSALATAETVYANQGATQAQIDAANTGLSSAVKALIKADVQKPTEKVDKTTLYTTIQTAKAQKEIENTSASYGVLKTALTAAETIYANPNATQTQINAANMTLDNAVKALIKLKVILTKNISLGQKESYSLKLKDVTYTSSVPKVAVVKAGVIKTYKIGKTVIKATDTNGNVSVYNITVKKAPAKITKLNATKKTLKKGKKFEIKVTLAKNTASHKITYMSKNKKVATVSVSGVVKAKKKGKAVIVVKTFNGKSKTCTVYVK